MEIIFLPPRNTSKVQPLDSSVIPAMKIKYRKHQMERALDLKDECLSDIYKVDFLSASRAFSRIWEDLYTSLIRNCWKHAGFLRGENRAYICFSVENLLSSECDEL